MHIGQRNTPQAKGPSPHADALLEAQNDLLWALDIFDDHGHVLPLQAQHRATLFEALKGDNAPLVLLDIDPNCSMFEQAPRAPGQLAEKDLPHGFAELATALADVAPHSLPVKALLATALKCVADAQTLEAVLNAYNRVEQTQSACHAMMDMDSSSDAPEFDSGGEYEECDESDDACVDETAYAGTTVTTTTTTNTTGTTATTKTSMTAQWTEANTMAAQQPGAGVLPWYASVPMTLSFQALSLQQANLAGEQSLLKAMAADEPDEVQNTLDAFPTWHRVLMAGKALHIACEMGKTKVLASLLATSDIDLNAQDETGFTLLHRAVWMGDDDLVGRLLKLPSVNVSLQNDQGNSPIFIAIGMRKLDIAQQLLAHGADLHHTNGAGLTPLQTACNGGNLRAVQMLVAQHEIQASQGAGSDMATVLNLWTTSGMTLLELARNFGERDVMAFLLAQKDIDPNQKNVFGLPFLHTAVLAGDIDTVKLLLKRQDVDPGLTLANGATPAGYAALGGHTELVELLRSHSSHVAPPGPNDLELLHSACLNGDLDAVLVWAQRHPARLRHDAGSGAGSALNETNATGWTPLQLAVQSGREKLLLWLLAQPDLDPNLGAWGNTPLHMLARSGGAIDLKLAAWLLVHPRIQVNAQSPGGVTAFYEAIQSGHIHMARLLQSKGANIRQLSGLLTPVQCACRVGNLALVRWLMELLSVPGAARGAITPAVLNQSGGLGATPLHLAASAGQTSVVQFLLEQPGIEPNKADAQGETPLHHAAKAGQIGAVALLLAHKADLHARCKNDATPLHLAIVNNQLALADMLLAHGATIRRAVRGGFTPIQAASHNDHLEAVQWLLSQLGHLRDGGPRDATTLLNQRAADGTTAMHLAAMAPSTRVLQFLLKRKDIDPNAANNEGMTPLLLAANVGHAEALTLLLKQPNVMALCLGPHKYSLLHFAILSNNTLPLVTAVSTLRPANFRTLADMPNEWGMRPSSMAIEFGKADVVRALPPAGAIKAKHVVRTAQKKGWLIVGYGHPQWAGEKLVKIGRKADIKMQAYGDGRDDLSWKGVLGLDLQGVDFIVFHCHAQWNQKLKTVTMELAQNEFVPLIDVARRFVQEGVVNVLFIGCEVVKAAQSLVNCFRDDPYFPRQADDGNGDLRLNYSLLGTDGGTLIELNTFTTGLWIEDFVTRNKGLAEGDAVALRSVQPMLTVRRDATKKEIVVEERAALGIEDLENLKDEHATSFKNHLLWMYAAENNLRKIRDLLSSHQVNINATTAAGDSALTLACLIGYSAMTRLLLEKGADFQQPNRRGHAPLHVACIFGHSKVVQLLLSYGAKIDQKDRSLATPLHAACMSGHGHLVNVLIDAGADPSLITNENLTPAQVARSTGHHDIAQRLDDLREKKKKKAAGALV